MSVKQAEMPPILSSSIHLSSSSRISHLSPSLTSIPTSIHPSIQSFPTNYTSFTTHKPPTQHRYHPATHHHTPQQPQLTNQPGSGAQTPPMT
ncbi:hypothetical protein VTJ04DRAFT_8955 [Mycothermus thermophilus]|uniref:uncharacterized protein n=1 Tax=Humicola insolens TaxID=85995 RepID=UPI0037443F39